MFIGNKKCRIYAACGVSQTPMNVHKSEEELHETAERILNDPSCGDVFRVKGFLRKEDGQWLELNATRHEICIRPAKLGQEIMIVIGEKLNKEVIDGYWK